MRKNKILVIDDEDIVLMSCRRALTPEGYDVKTVRSGEDGLQMLAGEEAYDLVLTDLKMPGIDGIEVLRIVKEKWPHIKVVIITGYQTVESAVKAVKLGAYDYIEKPFTPEQILLAVRNALKH